MSLYIPSRNALFIHVPKTGGTTIHRWLTKHTDSAYLQKDGKGLPCHLPAYMLRDHFDEKTWRGLFKFCFVRNPYDWVESIRAYSAIHEDGQLYKAATGDPVKWAEELYKLCVREHPTANGPILFQRHWVAGCDAMYRFEGLAYSIGPDELSDRFDIANDLEHHNYNGTPRLPIKGKYRDAIADLFKYDFQALDYPR